MYLITPPFIKKCLKAFWSLILWHMSQHLFLKFRWKWTFRKRRNFKCHIFLFWKMNCRYDVVHIFNFFWYKSDTFIFLLLIFTERDTTTHVHSSYSHTYFYTQCIRLQNNWSQGRNTSYFLFYVILFFYFSSHKKTNIHIYDLFVNVPSASFWQ